MKTGIVILNYNNPTDTINCIDSVLKYNTASIKFFVVDNGSPSEDCVPTLDRWMGDRFGESYANLRESDFTEQVFPELTFIVSDQNDGYAKGNNKGLNFAFNDPEVDSILVLNNDILFVEDIIPKMLESLTTIPDAGIVSPLLLKKDGIDIDYNCARENVDFFTLSIDHLTLKKRIFKFQKNAKDKTLLIKRDPQLLNKDSYEIQLPSGSCMLLESQFFKSIGGFAPETFLYFEENILYSKIKKLNKKAYLLPQIRCIHLGASTIAKHKRRYEFDKKCDRSAWVYVNKYADVSMLRKFFFNVCFSIYSGNRYVINKIKNA